jgi:threonine dehydrogenase-like Zn-dependent dehydrogenase
MKTRAVRMYGKNDLRLETFDLPEIKEDEILVKVVADSICMSTYKAVSLGKEHKRVPLNIDTNPVIVGHEMAGYIVEVGEKYKDEFKPGQQFALQPALNYKGSPEAPGYSFEWFGGNAEYNVIPKEVMELGCLIPFEGEGLYNACLAEPMSCVIGGFHANYHTVQGKYEHIMGTKKDGNLVVLGGAGPMGLGAVDYAMNIDAKPAKIVVTDVSVERLERAARVLPVEKAKELGVELHYVNVGDLEDPIKYLMDLTDGYGYDDAFVYAPVRVLAEQADQLLAKDGCMNFFAGPRDNQFKAELNLYNVHYSLTHIMGSTGGNTDDLIESLEMTAEGKINPAVMLTHIGGIDAVADAVIDLPNLPGGKKMIYNFIEMPLTAIDDFEELGKTNDLFKSLHEICKRYNGLWNAEAEKFLLEYYGV